MREGEEDRTNNEKYIYTTITQCILDLLLNESHQELLDPLILKNWSVSEIVIRLFTKNDAKMSYKVAVCGGSGGIGQPLSMLLAQNPRVKEVCVIDVDRAMVPASGVATDLSHLVDLDCANSCVVKGYSISTAPDAVTQKDCPCFLYSSFLTLNLFTAKAKGPNTRGLRGMQPRPDSGWHSSQARHDPRRPLRHQCWHRAGPRRGLRRTLPRGRPRDDCEPCKFGGTSHGHALREEGPQPNEGPSLSRPVLSSIVN